MQVGQPVALNHSVELLHAQDVTGLSPRRIHFPSPRCLLVTHGRTMTSYRTRRGGAAPYADLGPVLEIPFVAQEQRDGHVLLLVILSFFLVGAVIFIGIFLLAFRRCSRGGPCTVNLYPIGN
ncbi:hypothetical protein EYF80_041619 [Liparis tanakae]|uniref:Uncharacterized protein n=1 Tax=Liparis tanakae TaxID=230148 RepID=A0A4Z2G3P9_9TELE|nr:hypothetical protein EYF80_041619 [Liparis tanakae]